VLRHYNGGESVVISLPREALELLGISKGSTVILELNREKHQVILSPIEKPLVTAGVDEKFARQISEFIDQYRPTLETLATS
jgi:bifunctional DNA-binding transcriptional regulator/antitoxin component of YhaV-PrlF toxin-antitoxin module